MISTAHSVDFMPVIIKSVLTKNFPTVNWLLFIKKYALVQLLFCFVQSWSD